MNKKSWIGVGLVSIFVFIFFMSYQLHQEGLFNFNKPIYHLFKPLTPISPTAFQPVDLICEYHHH